MRTTRTRIRSDAAAIFVVGCFVAVVLVLCSVNSFVGHDETKEPGEFETPEHNMKL